MKALVPTPPARPVVSVSKQTRRSRATAVMSGPGKAAARASLGQRVCTRYRPSARRVPPAPPGGALSLDRANAQQAAAAGDSASLGGRGSARPPAPQHAQSISARVTPAVPAPPGPRPAATSASSSAASTGPTQAGQPLRQSHSHTSANASATSCGARPQQLAQADAARVVVIQVDGGAEVGRGGRIGRSARGPCSLAAALPIPGWQTRRRRRAYGLLDRSRPSAMACTWATVCRA